jgi:hypothetical protein
VITGAQARPDVLDEINAFRAGDPPMGDKAEALEQARCAYINLGQRP